MIVADTNLIAGLFLAGSRSRVFQRVLELDAIWVAPPLWRSEFRSVLLKYIVHGSLSVADASKLMEEAARVIGSREREPAAGLVLALAHRSGCSSYDCEFVALAVELRVPLVTDDRQVLRAFVADAVTPERFDPR